MLKRDWRRRLRRRWNKNLSFERLEDRRLLAAVPIAADDPSYITAVNTALTVGSSVSLLQNDWDPDGGTLGATVVQNPSHGTLSNFSSTAGTFTYTPDTDFTGIDQFTYQIDDGTNDGNIATVSIAVGGSFGARTNLAAITGTSSLLTGGNLFTHLLTPGVELIYNSLTLPRPIIVLETFLQSTASVPDSIKAQLTFNGTAGTEYSYSNSGLAAGDSLRFALQADATSLATGFYDYSIKLTAVYSSSSVEQTYTGSQAVVNRSGATAPFGRGWQLAGLDQLVSGTGGMLWVQAAGDAYWFPDDRILSLGPS